jgi:hypothetical protein
MSSPTLDIIAKAAGRSDAPNWGALGFLRNPFPSRAHPNWKVFHNQASVRDRFDADLDLFLRERRTETMFFTGGNRVGKTHFMQYHRQLLTDGFIDAGVVAPIALASVESCDFAILYRRLIEDIEESLRHQTGSGLFETIPPVTTLNKLPPGDLRSGLLAVAADTSGDETKKVLLRRWIRGERIRQPERRQIDVTCILDSQAQMLSAFGSLVAYFLMQQSDAQRWPGVIVFLDEFELIWTVRRDRRDQFLQALRALVDACAHGGLFLCIGMATGIGPDVQQVEASYPALYARVTGAREIPALVQIGGVVEALEYVTAFEAHGRKEFTQKSPKAQVPPAPLISQREVEQLFREVGGGGSVAQGEFFDKVHLYAEQKAAAGRR